MNHVLLKELAREHGCLESVHIGTSFERVPQKQKQIFDYIIIIDFESTCWSDGNLKRQPEIIEFPAVLLNTSTGAIESEFQQYVMPTENPKLSKFCRTFTGIKQEQVDNGMPLPTCLLLFSHWINKITEEKSLIFHKQDTSHKSCTFVTWSDWDLSMCLHNECKRKNLLKSELLNQWIDLRAIYKTFYKRQPKGLNGAMSEVGLKFEGRQHSGISDARNTAALAYHLVKDGALLNITKRLQSTVLIHSLRYTMRKKPLEIPQDSKTQKGMVALNHSGTPVSSKTWCQRIEHYQGSERKIAKNALWRKANTCNENANTCRGQTILSNCTKSRDRTPLQPIKCPVADRTGSIKKNQAVNCRRTPPLCKCGRRALCRIVSILGPNQGRTFFVCSHKKSLGTVRKSACDFFKWEP